MGHYTVMDLRLTGMNEGNLKEVLEQIDMTAEEVDALASLSQYDKLTLDGGNLVIQRVSDQ